MSKIATYKNFHLSKLFYVNAEKISLRGLRELLPKKMLVSIFLSVYHPKLVLLIPMLLMKNFLTHSKFAYSSQVLLTHPQQKFINVYIN